MTRSRARLSLLVAATSFFSPTFPNAALGQTVSFTPAATFGVGTHPQSVAVGDFNGDGKPDLAVANAGSDTVSVLLGDGDGTFQAARTVAAGSAPVFLAVGDFNGDGKSDLVVADYGFAPDYSCYPCNRSTTFSALLGNGDGTFQSARTVGAGSGPNSVAVGDFNGDGKLDLAVANYDSTTVSVLLGNGDGTFQTAQNFGAGGSPAFVAAGDFNGDGKLDLAVANYGSTTVSVLISNSDRPVATALS